MTRLQLGLICGLVYGVVTVASMVPLSFPDKRTAMVAAFLNRFGIGLVICVVALPWPGWLVGLLFGILLSLPDAIVTRAYAPIMIFGALGGTVIGMIAGKFGR